MNKKTNTEALSIYRMEDVKVFPSLHLLWHRFSIFISATANVSVFLMIVSACCFD